MNDLGGNTQSSPQPNLEKMKAIMAKVAKIQKILGVLSTGQILVGIIALSAPIWASFLGMQLHSVLPFLFIAPFLFGLAYEASFAKKDLSSARVVFRNTAISQLGIFLITLFAVLVYGLVSAFYLFLLASLFFGGLAGMVLYQALKEQK